jgi:predicted RNA binding protein YcfA (HicA-like mRNA interferase family)
MFDKKVDRFTVQRFTIKMVFKRLGYEKVSQKRRHIKMKNYDNGDFVIIPTIKSLTAGH